MLSKKALIGVGLVAAAAGVFASTQIGSSGSTTPLCTTPCVGETLSVTAQFTNPPKASGLITTAINYLKTTTITGEKYFLNYAAYKGGAWYNGLGALTLAQFLSQNKAIYDQAGTLLQNTTITGTRYFANPTKYVGGNWDQAIKLYNQEIITLASEVPTDPTIQR